MEDKKEPITRIWKAKMRCLMPEGPYNSGQTVELTDEQVTERHRVLFECLTPDEVKQEEERAKIADDPELKVMRDRLKNAKVNIPRRATPEQIRKLFNDNLGSAKVILPD